MRFRKKPVEIEAVQLRWDTWSEMCEHADVGRLEDGKPQGGYWAAYGDEIEPRFHDDSRYFTEGVPSVITDDKLALAIPTLEGLMVAIEGDWVIRGVQGELYPCKPEIFEATYEEV